MSFKKVKVIANFLPDGRDLNNCINYVYERLSHTAPLPRSTGRKLSVHKTFKKDTF